MGIQRGDVSIQALMLNRASFPQASRRGVTLPINRRRWIESNKGNPPVPERDQMLDRLTCAGAIINADSMRLDGSHTLDLDNRDASGDCQANIRFIRHCREEDRVDALAEERLDRTSFGASVALGIEENDSPSVPCRFLLNGERDGCEERVGRDRLEHVPQEKRSSSSQPLRYGVDAVFGLSKRRLDRTASIVGNVPVVVEHTRNRCGRYPG
jgi:hypothetical protein